MTPINISSGEDAFLNTELQNVNDYSHHSETQTKNPAATGFSPRSSHSRPVTPNDSERVTEYKYVFIQ